MSGWSARGYASALADARPLELLAADGQVLDLDVRRWLSGVDDADRSVLRRCTPPTLDLGCGPGRFVEALSSRGSAALGIDIAGTAVALTRSRGTPALLRDIFGDLPGAGRWPTVLLMDGNIGIGGNPRRLLSRVRALLAPSGRLVVETDPDDEADEVLVVRLRVDGQLHDQPFRWARVGTVTLDPLAHGVGLRVEESWTAQGRTFVALAPVPRLSRTTLHT